MGRRNWLSRIWTFTPLTGNASSVYLGSPDPSTTLCGTNHNILELEGDYDQVQLIFGSFSSTDDLIIAGACAIAPSSLSDKVQDAAFATAQAFTFNGAAGVTIPKISGQAYPNVVLTDPMNITSVARSDGGTKPLLGFRIKISLPSGNTNKITYFSKVGADWGTDGQVGWHASASGDSLNSAFPRTPASSGFGATIACLGIRYLSRKRGMTIMWVGDSLTACASTSYTTKKYGGYPINSAIANSSLAHPIEFVNCGMSSQSAAQYQAAATYLMPLIYPTHVIEEFWSPNSISSPIIGSQITDIQAQQATVFANAALIGAVRCMWNGIPECTNAACTTSVYSASDDALRVSTLNAQALLGYPTLDLNTVIKTNTSPQLIQSTSNGYATNFSDDGLHPNQAADDQQLTPAATTFVSQLNSSFQAEAHVAYQIRIPGGSFMNGLTGIYNIRIPGGIFFNDASPGGVAGRGMGKSLSLGISISIP